VGLHGPCNGVRFGVSKGVEDDRRPPALQVGRKAVSGMDHLQGVEGSGMAGPGETLESPWIPFAVRACDCECDGGLDIHVLVLPLFHGFGVGRRHQSDADAEGRVTSAAFRQVTTGKPKMVALPETPTCARANRSRAEEKVIPRRTKSCHATSCHIMSRHASPGLVLP
jgi:hypothetical protein